MLEIVVERHSTPPAIAGAMRVGIDAACREGVVAITAGNYGGKLGPHHFHLRKIMSGAGRMSDGIVARPAEPADRSR